MNLSPPPGSLPLAVCLMGPTASGKTDLALEWAQSGDYEIINVDPAQMVRGMDIGTGKPSSEIRASVPHHLMDCLAPTEIYSAGRFYHDALAAMKAITARGKTPLLVGGTMLYFKALQQGLSPLPPASMAVRAQLQSILQTNGLATLYEQLKACDPMIAAQLNPTDPQRIIRGLEVFQITGKPLSYWHQQPREEPPYHFLNIALMPLRDNRAVLHNRIAKRFDAMLSAGLIEEVNTLWELVKYNADLPALRAVGYRQVIPYIQGDNNYDEMKEKAIAATRQLAKRQLTWLRHWQDCHLLDFEAPKEPKYLANQQQHPA